MRELIGTTWLIVGKPKQVKIYVDPSLVQRGEEVFERQGLTNSEGWSRLMRLLLKSPEEMIPVILSQAPGDAAIALAKATLKRKRPLKGSVDAKLEQI